MKADLVRRLSVGSGTKTLVVAIGIAVLLVAGACGVGRESYVRQNERILETLPQIPGSQQRTVQSSPYYLGDDGSVDGYTTNVVYRASPDITAQEVIDFYVRSLEDEWEYELEEIPTLRLDIAVPGQPDTLDGAEPGQPDDSILLVNFTKGENEVSINTDNMTGGAGQTFELVVDHQGAR